MMSGSPNLASTRKSSKRPSTRWMLTRASKVLRKMNTNSMFMGTAKDSDEDSITRKAVS